MPHPGSHSRPGWMWLWAAWSSLVLNVEIDGLADKRQTDFNSEQRSSHKLLQNM